MEIVGPLKIPKKWDKKGIHEISQISLFHLTTNSWMVGEVHLLISAFPSSLSFIYSPLYPCHFIPQDPLYFSFFSLLILHSLTRRLIQALLYCPIPSMSFLPKTSSLFLLFHIFVSTYFSPEPYHFPPVSLLLLCTGS